MDYVEDKSNLTLDEFTQLVLERFLNPTEVSLVAQFNTLVRLLKLKGVTW